MLLKSESNSPLNFRFLNNSNKIVFVTPLRGYQALDMIGLYDKDDIGRNNDNKSVFLFFFFSSN